MKGPQQASSTLKHRSTTANGEPTTTTANGHNPTKDAAFEADSRMGKKGFTKSDAFILQWRIHDMLTVWKHHPVPTFFGSCLLFFMAVEYTLYMIPSSSPPFDLGFIATKWLHTIFATQPITNTICAALNTVFVAMQTGYILYTWLIEGRLRPTVSTLFMFTCRGILGYVTQLPLPEEFVGSGADFPVGNVSFFLFYSGHVAGAVIASIDMRRMGREGLAAVFDVLNLLQIVRLLGSRGHYTIDLAVGVGAGMLFDELGGRYMEGKRKKYESLGSNGVELDGLVK